MKKQDARKQIRFKDVEQIKTIKIAVKIISDKLTQGESISFSSFVHMAAYAAALQVIKDNPNAIADSKNPSHS